MKVMSTSKRKSGIARATPDPYCLSQLQSGDLVSTEHREPGVAVGGDGDPERLAALDGLRLGRDDTSGRDPGDVSCGGAGEPHRAVSGRSDVLWPAVGREQCHGIGGRVDAPHRLRYEPLGEPHRPIACDVDLAGEALDVDLSDAPCGRVEPADPAVGIREPHDAVRSYGDIQRDRVWRRELGEGIGGDVVAPYAVVVEVGEPDVIAVGIEPVAVGGEHSGYIREHRATRGDPPQRRVVLGEVEDPVRTLHDVGREAEVAHVELCDLTCRRYAANLVRCRVLVVYEGLGKPEIPIRSARDVLRAATSGRNLELLEHPDRRGLCGRERRYERYGKPHNHSEHQREQTHGRRSLVGKNSSSWGRIRMFLCCHEGSTLSRVAGNYYDQLTEVYTCRVPR